nr:hypothetical protein [uncultured Mediterraneibacter sp.]
MSITPLIGMEDARIVLNVSHHFAPVVAGYFCWRVLFYRSYKMMKYDHVIYFRS